MGTPTKEFKVRINGDESGFNKAARQAQSDMRALKRSTDDLTSSIADAFGVPLDKLKRFSSSLRGAAAQAEKTGAQGAGALKAIAGAASGAGVAIAAMGIGAAVTAFKLLNAEAQNFMSEWDGMELKAGLDTYVSTYKDVFHDLNTEIGESTAELGAELKKKWTAIWTSLKDVTLQTLVGGTDLGTAIMNTVTKATAANAVAAQGEELAKQLTGVQKTWIGTGVGTAGEGTQTKIAKLDAEIAKWQLVAYDNSVSATEQQAAMAKVIDLINQKYQLQITYQQQIATLTRQIATLTSSTPEQMQAAADEETKLIMLEAQRDQQLRALSKRQSTIAKNIAAEAAAEAKALQDTIDASVKDLNAQVALELDEESEELLNEVIQGIDLTPLKVEVEPNINVEKINKVFLDLNSAVQGMVADMASAVGELMGDLLTNSEDAWSSFGQAAVNAVADMAISIGKLAISTGATALALEKLALDPMSAIIAGTALVALGAAAKKAIANITAGKTDYTATSSVAHSGYGRGNYIAGYDQVPIEVTGTLKAEGSQLVAVIESENKRHRRTT